MIDLVPPRAPDPAERSRPAGGGESTVWDGLAVPPGMLEAADDRRATVTPLASVRPAPDRAEPTPEPPDAQRRGPLLPRMREYRPVDDA